MLIANAKVVGELALKHRVPCIGFVEIGDSALMSYGANFPDMWRRSAAYIDKILKGVKPGDIPIEQAARFELLINMKTAKALGLKIPQSILVRADRVIE
jgi:putative ABC transport system substrate-binding protein